MSTTTASPGLCGHRPPPPKHTPGEGVLHLRSAPGARCFQGSSAPFPHATQPTGYSITKQDLFRKKKGYDRASAGVAITRSRTETKNVLYRRKRKWGDEAARNTEPCCSRSQSCRLPQGERPHLASAFSARKKREGGEQPCPGSPGHHRDLGGPGSLAGGLRVPGHWGL